MIKKINSDMVEAMKEKNTEKLGVLRAVKAFLADSMRSSGEVTDTKVISTIRKIIKKREESAEQFGKADRGDLEKKELAEIKILKEYLPEDIPSAELEKIVKKVFKEQGATSKKNAGAVIKAVTEEVCGGADGKTISATVMKELAKKEAAAQEKLEKESAKTEDDLPEKAAHILE